MRHANSTHELCIIYDDNALFDRAISFDDGGDSNDFVRGENSASIQRTDCAFNVSDLRLEHAVDEPLSARDHREATRRIGPSLDDHATLDVDTSSS